MNQDFYQLANEIDSTGESYTQSEEILDGFTAKKYRQKVLAAVRKEKGRAKRKRWMAAAAGFAFITAAAGAFHNEVQAAVERIQYSLSTALGLESDLACYKEVVRTSVSSGGYVITLQEAVAAPEELRVSYTLQREDGQPVRENPALHGSLSINGQRAYGSSGGSIRDLDKEGKIQGHETAYTLPGIDLSRENVYELSFIDLSQKSRGSWEFKFKADGSELSASTKHMELGNMFTLPNGIEVVLDELAVNDLEQRVTYHTSKDDPARYILQLHVTDGKGHMVRFQVDSFGYGRGYMQNTVSPESSWLTEDAQDVTAALYFYELPEDNEKTAEEPMRQVGGAADWDMTGLR